jgi:hypothetical protein
MMTHKMGSPGSIQSFKYEGPSGPNYTTYKWDENATAWEVWKNMNYIILTKDNIVHWYHGNLMGGPKNKPQPEHGFEGSTGEELPKLNIERFGFKVYKALLNDPSVGYIVSSSEASDMVKNKVYKWLLKDPNFVWISTGNVDENGMGYDDVIIINPKYTNVDKVKETFESKHNGKKINYSKNFPKTQKTESIKTKAQILSEGRYDSLVRTISNDILNEIKISAENEDSSFDDVIGEYEHESGVLIPVVLELYRYLNTEETWFKFIVNSFIDYDDYLVVRVFINSDYEPQVYENLYYKINEDIRHEIEHYVQTIDKKEREEYKEKGIEEPTRFRDRNQPLIPNTADYETTFEHHMDPSEVEALVHGFYRRAKLEKLPLDVVMTRDLEHEMKEGNLTEDEAKELFTTWLSYAKRNLPRAIYSIK